MADIKAPVLGEYQVIPHLMRDTMAGSKPYVAKPDIQAGMGFPKELVPDWENVAVKKLGDLVSQARAPGVPGFMREVLRLHRQVPLLSWHFRPEKYAGRAPGLAAFRIPALLHLRRKILPQARRRARHDQGRARRMVYLLSPMLAVPPLLGVLPLWHRYRRDFDGRARNHGHRRSGPEVLQRNPRQGLHDRQQPRSAGAGARQHAGGPRGRRQGRYRRGREVPG